MFPVKIVVTLKPISKLNYFAGLHVLYDVRQARVRVFVGALEALELVGTVLDEKDVGHDIVPVI